MSFTFINTKKNYPIKIAYLTELVKGLPQSFTAKLNQLKTFNDQTIPQHINFYIQAIKLTTDLKKKQQFYYLISYVLTLIDNNTQALVIHFESISAIQQPILFKVKMYSQLFKTVKNKTFKKNILTDSIYLLSKEKKINYLTSFLNDIDSLLRQLQLTTQQLSKVYIDIIKSIKDNPFYKELAVQFIVKFLEIVNNFAYYSNQVDQYFIYLIKNAVIQQKIVLLSQSFNLKPIENKLLFKLFRIYLSGNYQEYLQLQKTNKDDLPNISGIYYVYQGLNIEEYVQKLKVQYIATIAQNCKVITYTQFANKLDINKQDVERYVIHAIQKSVISATLDEFDEIILIKEIKSKYFSTNQWPKILSDLQMLTEKFQNYLK